MSLEKSIRNLGKVYGLAERVLPKVFSDPTKVAAASLAPMDSLPEIMRALISSREVSGNLDEDIRELLDDVDETTPEHIDVPTQSYWWLGYNSTRPTGYDKGIAAARKRKKMTQAELAKAIGTDQRTVSRWETGVSAPSTEMLKKTAEALACSADDLV